MRADLRGTLTVAALYALANAGLRLVGGNRLAMDDAKTNLFTQVWRWGYQADNPPLYEWLMGCLHVVTGGGLWSFLVLNAVCLTAAAGFIHASVRPWTGERAAFGTACGLVLLYQVGWNYHQAFTHSALLLVMVAVGLWAGSRLVRAPTPSAYLSFGLALGLGMMAKYNFALFALGFLGAALTTPHGRRAVMSPWMLASLVVAALILAPHAAWLAGRADVYASTLPDTLGLAGSRLGRTAEGAVSLAVAVISFFLPWALVYCYLRWRIVPPRAGGPNPSAEGPRGGRGADGLLRNLPPRDRRSRSPHEWGDRAPGSELALLLRTALIATTLIFLGVLVFGIGAVSERYVIPALLPAYAGLTGSLLAARPAALRPYLLASLAAAVLISGMRLAGFLVPGPPFCEDCRAFVPYEALTEILRETVPADAILLAREENTAGNLVAAFPRARVTSLNLLTQFNPATPADAARPCYYVWSEDMTGGVPLFPVFRFAHDDPRTVMVDAPWRHPLREPGFRRTVWGVTPLEGPLYARFCAADAPG